MQLGFKDVEAVFASRHGIGRDREIAFRGRLQHLQRLRFPSGVNTGKGKRAIYGWSQVIELSLALDLMELGLAPEVVVDLVRPHAHDLMSAVGNIPSLFDGTVALSRSIEEERCPVEQTLFVLASAGALSGLRADGSVTQPLLSWCTAEAFLENLRTSSAYEVAAAYVDMGTRLFLTIKLIALLTGSELETLTADFLAWGDRRVDP